MLRQAVIVTVFRIARNTKALTEFNTCAVYDIKYLLVTPCDSFRSLTSH